MELLLTHHHHHHNHHRLSIRFSLTIGVGRVPRMYSLHCARFCAISGFKFNSFMSSLTHSSRVFLALLLQPFLSTFSFCQAFTHSPIPFHLSKQNKSTFLTT